MAGQRAAALETIRVLLETIQGQLTVCVLAQDGVNCSIQMPPRGTADGPLDQCKGDILRTLSMTQHRLTTSKLLAAMERNGYIWGESTIKNKLAEMVDDKILTNTRNGDPSGYGLPDWDKA